MPKKEEEKNCYPFSYPILRGHDSTRALQSSRFHKYKNIKESRKTLFFFKFCRGKQAIQY